MRKINYMLLLVSLLSSNFLSTKAQLIFKTSIQTLDANGNTFSIGDLNNDGFPDIYLSTSSNAGNIWLNNGQGSFIKAQSIGYEKLTNHTAFADLDGDGDLDLFFANDASYLNVAEYLTGCPNEVWFNDGKGNFSNSGQLLGYEPSLGVQLGDVDNDGDVDAVVSNYHPANDPTYLKYKPDEIWMNDGKGNFSLSQTLGYGMGGARLIDLNNDKNIDIVDKDTIWFNDGKGKYTKSAKKIGDNSYLTEFADLNNDGNTDAFISIWSASAQVWINDGAGNFTDSQQRIGNMKCNNIKLFDFDSDGDLDAFTNNYSGACKLWINQGGKQNGQAGNFKDSGLTLPSGLGTLCDFNKDGKLDAIIGNKIYLNEYVATSIQDANNNIKINIFPNPTTGNIIIDFGSDQIKQAIMEIYNTHGRRLFSEILKNTTIKSISLTGYPEGIYFVRLIIDGEIISKQVCVNE